MKIFYIIENASDYVQANFFKTEKEAISYGESKVDGFDITDENEGEDDEVYFGGPLNFKKGFLLSLEYGEGVVIPMDDQEAREYVEEELQDEGMAMYFDGFKKGAYGYIEDEDRYDGKHWSWYWNMDDILEGLSVDESKNKIHKMKHVKMFEQFVNEKKYSSSDVKKLKEFAEEVSDEIYFDYEDAFDRKSSGLDAEDFSADQMYDYIVDWGETNDMTAKEVMDEFNWRELTYELGLA